MRRHSLGNDQILALTGTIVAMRAEMSEQQIRLVVVTLPLMTGLSPANVQSFVFNRTMPDDAYDTYVTQDALVALGAARASVTAQSATGLTVTTTPGIVALNTKIFVTCWYDQAI